MAKILDITGIINERKEAAWMKFVRLQIINATSPEDELRWREIEIALLFNQYYKNYGYYHPNDPLSLSGSPYLID